MISNNISQNGQKRTDRQVAKQLIANHTARVVKLENGIAKLEHGIEDLRNENIDLMSERQRLQNIIKNRKMQ